MAKGIIERKIQPDSNRDNFLASSKIMTIIRLAQQLFSTSLKMNGSKQRSVKNTPAHNMLIQKGLDIEKSRKYHFLLA